MLPRAEEFAPMRKKGRGTEEEVGERRGGGGVLIIMHGRGRMTLDPRIPAMSGRDTSGFH